MKGGVLVANLLDSPHRFTRDIDLLRRRGRPSADDLREMFRDIIAIAEDDGIAFRAQWVRAAVAQRDDDGYDGVKVFVRASVGNHEVNVRVDVGFGDAVVPPAGRRILAPFLQGDTPARVLAYRPEVVVAEKVETLASKFPAVLHRLKDILDVVALAEAHTFAGLDLVESLRATFGRRTTPADTRLLDEMHEMIGHRGWQTAWAAMLKEKVVVSPLDLRDAIARFDTFVRPVLASLATDVTMPGLWAPGGPWS